MKLHERCKAIANHDAELMCANWFSWLLIAARDMDNMMQYRAIPQEELEAIQERFLAMAERAVSQFRNGQ